MDYRNEARDTDPTDRHYTVTQPQFRRPSQGGYARDRYRAPRHRDDVYDMPEGDDAYDHGLELDAFDRDVLEHAYGNDRLSQAERGETRLSFPSKMSRPAFLNVPPQLHQSTGRLRDDREVYVDQGDYTSGVDLPGHSYRDKGAEDASSETRFGPSSSPAFQAGRRRAVDEVHSTLQETDVGKSRARPAKALSQSTPATYASTSQRLVPPAVDVPRTAPMVQGIPLVFVTELPDRFRAIFSFPTFNAVQSKCFSKAYKTNDNLVLASPTGSGKTAILELAICRAVMNGAANQHKIVYQAPLKALCSERQRDWQSKFKVLGLNCVELTGDSDASDLQNVQTADIIVTTPEKWDSLTRKWKDHEKLMRLVKLFLVDEVHILKESRGAVLEAVLSRMKTMGTDVRFLALSATVPNSEDVATWLGKSAAAPYEPAHHEKFGEDFRPVKLRKHICGYPYNNGNDFQFETYLDHKLPEVITTYSERKPIMIFCFTRKSTVSTAKMLSAWWSSNQSRHWNAPSTPLNLQDPELRACAISGVAFHHAGLEADDRSKVEDAYLNGQIGVICCTSTLAVGVNLPCHFVIIKNTVTYSDDGLQEYSDLEVMQMMGRAGRPQFDSSAIAVIMTRAIKVRRYENMVSGQEILESKLHHGLVEHLNAEVVLGTVFDLASARKWLSGTFLNVRLKQNPAHYRIKGADPGKALDEQLDHICRQNIQLLQQTELLSEDEIFRCTGYGDAMARYYVKFETMQVFLGLQAKSSISETLSALCQAEEFKDFRFRSGEKPIYKRLNSSPSIRFQLSCNLDRPAHKVSLIIQSVLGGADPVGEKDDLKHRQQYLREVSAIWKVVSRLIRCIVDCQIHRSDSVSVAHALLVQRSISARAWDDGPIQMKQIQGVGDVAVRKLVQAGIRSVEEIESAEPHRLETIIGRNPPFGLQLLEKLKSFPKLRVSLQVLDSMKQTDAGVIVQVKAEIGFLNDTPPITWQRTYLYLCVLFETSDGRLVHFARISGKNLGNGQTLNVPALITSNDQFVNCTISCEEIAGTMRSATVKPKIPPSLFPVPKPDSTTTKTTHSNRPMSNTSKRRTESATPSKFTATSDDFDDGIEDEDLVSASFSDLNFDHIENYANPIDALTRKNTVKNSKKSAAPKKTGRTLSPGSDDHEPQQLDNGRWACNHKCKDKKACRHLCCKDGVDKPSKKSMKKRADGEISFTDNHQRKQPDQGSGTQSKSQVSAAKRRPSMGIDEIDLTQRETKKQKAMLGKSGPREYRDLDRLHRQVQGSKSTPANVKTFKDQQPVYCYSAGGEHSLSFLSGHGSAETLPSSSSDYGDMVGAEMSDNMGARNTDSGEGSVTNKQDKDSGHKPREDNCEQNQSNPYSDAFEGDSILEDAMVGLADSQDIQHSSRNDDQDDEWTGIADQFLDLDYAHGHEQEETVEQQPALRLRGDVHSEQSASRTEPLTPVHANVTMQPHPAVVHARTSESVRDETAHEPRVTHENSVMEDTNVVDVQQQKVQYQEDKEMPDAFKDLEPWLFAEFGDIVEIVD